MGLAAVVPVTARGHPEYVGRPLGEQVRDVREMLVDAVGELVADDVDARLRDDGRDLVSLVVLDDVVGDDDVRVLKEAGEVPGLVGGVHDHVHLVPVAVPAPQVEDEQVHVPGDLQAVEDVDGGGLAPRLEEARRAIVRVAGIERVRGIGRLAVPPVVVLVFEDRVDIVDHDRVAAALGIDHLELVPAVAAAAHVQRYGAAELRLAVAGDAGELCVLAHDLAGPGVDEVFEGARARPAVRGRHLHAPDQAVADHTSLGLVQVEGVVARTGRPARCLDHAHPIGLDGELRARGGRIGNAEIASDLGLDDGLRDSRHDVDLHLPLQVIVRARDRARGARLDDDRAGEHG